MKSDSQQLERMTRWAMAIALVALIIALYSISVSGAKAVINDVPLPYSKHMKDGLVEVKFAPTASDGNGELYFTAGNENNYAQFIRNNIIWATDDGTQTVYLSAVSGAGITIQGETAYYRGAYVVASKNIDAEYQNGAAQVKYLLNLSNITAPADETNRLKEYLTILIPVSSVVRLPDGSTWDKTTTKNITNFKIEYTDGKKLEVPQPYVFDRTNPSSMSYGYYILAKQGGKLRGSIMSPPYSAWKNYAVPYLDPTISGGAVGYYNLTVTNVNNGSYINLSSVVNATSISYSMNVSINNSNISRGKTCYASSEYSGSYLCSKALDGLYVSGSHANSWISADSPTFPVNYTVNLSVNSSWNTVTHVQGFGYHAKNFSVYYSLDNVIFTYLGDFLECADVTNTKCIYYSPTVINSKWIRLSYTSQSADAGNGIASSEIEVHNNNTVFTSWVTEKTNSSAVNQGNGTYSFTGFVNPVQNFQFFNNVSSSMNITLSIQYSGDTISQSITAVNGKYWQNTTYQPVDNATNITLTFPINSATFTDATYKGTLTVISNIQSNVTASGYNSTHVWVNYSAIAKDFNTTTNFSISYNNNATASVNSQSFEVGGAITVTCTANDPESNALNISMTVNGTLKQGSSCSFDFSGLAIGNYSSSLNVTDFNGTIGTLPHNYSNFSFFVNVSADVTAPSTPTISNSTPSQTTLVLSSTNETEYVNYTWWRKENTTSTWLNWTTTTTNTTTVTGITSCSENDYFVQVYDAGGNYANSSQITVQQACENAEYAAIVTKLNTVINNQAEIQAEQATQSTSLNDADMGAVGIVGGLLGGVLVIGVLNRNRRE